MVLQQALALVGKHKGIVQLYYLEYLGGADAAALAGFDMASLGALAPLAQQFTDAVQSSSASKLDRGVDFSAGRGLWEAVEVGLSENKNLGIFMKANQAIKKFQLAYSHMKNVDQLDQMLHDHGNLKSLWYLAPQVFQSFQLAMDQQISNHYVGHTHPLELSTYFSLVQQFPQNTSDLWPEEMALIGVEAVKMTEELLTRLAKKIVDIVRSNAKTHIAMNDQISPVHAAYPLFSKNANWKPPKDFHAPVPPGSESNLKARDNLEGLRRNEKTVAMLCSAIENWSSIVIFDTELCPHAFLEEALASNMADFLRVAFQGNPEIGMGRPTTIEIGLHSYLSSVLTLTKYVSLDLTSLWRVVYLRAFTIPNMPPSGKYDWMPENPVELKGPIGFIVNFYNDLLTKRIPAPNSGIVFSRNRQGFISKASAQFKAELYADFAELCALCRLIGPYGVKLIERQLALNILESVKEIKTLIQSNSALLAEIQRNYLDEGRVNESLKRLKDADVFVARNVSVGLHFAFRRALREALGTVLDSDLPYIPRVVSSVFDQYTANLFMAADFLPVDTLAADCGLPLATADQFMKHAFRKLNSESDKKVWALLPTFFAACLPVAAAFKEPRYRTVVEAAENNVHVLAYSINQLLIDLKSICTREQEEVHSTLIEFANMASVLVLRLTDLSKKTADLPSLVVLMDLFLQECPVLTRDVFDSAIPYPLIRNMWNLVNQDRIAKGAEEEIF